MIEEFSALMKKFAFIMLQEKGAIADTNILNNHIVIGSMETDRTPILIIHKALSRFIVATKCCSCAAAGLIRTSQGIVVLVSCYLPDVQKPMDTFASAIMDLDSILQELFAEARLHRCMPKIIIGGDLNVEMTPALVVGPGTSGRGGSFDRETLLLAWASKWSIEWRSTWQLSDTDCTIQHLSSGKRYILDYILCSSDVTLQSSVVYDLDFASDHHPLEVRAVLTTLTPKADTKRRADTLEELIGNTPKLLTF